MANKKRQSRIWLVFLVVILMVGVFFRFYRLGEQSFWLDELTSVGLSILNFKDWLSFILYKDIDMSFFQLVGYFWVKAVSGNSDGIIRILPAFFSTLNIITVFFLGKSLLVNKKKAIFLGLISALLVSLNAYDLQYAQEFRSYSLISLLVSFLTLLFIKIIKRPNFWINWFLYVVFSLMALYSHHFAIFISVAHLVMFFVIFGKNFSNSPYKQVIISGFIMTVFLMPLAFFSYKQRYLQITWVPMPDFNIIKDFFINICGNYGGFLVIVYLLTAFFGFKSESKKWKWQLIGLSFCLPIFLSLAISPIRPIFWSRYLLLTLPFLVILTARGILSLIDFDKWNKKNFLGIILLLFFIVFSMLGINDYFKNFKKEDFRGVAKILSENCNKNLVIFDPPMLEPRVNYYLDKKCKTPTVMRWYYESDKDCSSQKTAIDLLDSSKFVYLVSGLDLMGDDNNDRRIIHEILLNKFTRKSKMELSQFNVEIYEANN